MPDPACSGHGRMPCSVVSVVSVVITGPATGGTARHDMPFCACNGRE